VIIAIDGASTDLSIAVARPDGVIVSEDGWSSSQRQSAELLPRLIELLARDGRTVGDATALAVGTGPGSFTGLRVAMALAKGMASALSRPIVGVPSLPAWLDAEPSAVAAVARAGAREGYLLVRGMDEVAIVDRDALAQLTGGTIVVPHELAVAFELGSTIPPRAAGAIARAAAVRLAQDPIGDDLRGLEPIYLRPPRGVRGDSEGRVRWL